MSSSLLQSAVLNMKLLIAPIFYALSVFSTVSAYNVYDLSDAKWTLSDSTGNVSVPGSLPSQVFRGLSYVFGDYADSYLRRILTCTEPV